MEEEITEVCEKDGEMSREFMFLVNFRESTVSCKSAIGWLEVDEPEFRNGVEYRVVVE